MIKSILGGLILLASCVTMQGQTLHAIYFGQTRDTSIGRSVYLDIIKWERAMETMANGANLSLEVEMRTGPDCTCSELQRVIDGLDVGSNDVIWFYYSGHGYNDTRDGCAFPSVGICRPSQSVGQYCTLTQQLRSKGARLTLVFGDLCNTAIPINDPTVAATNEPLEMYKCYQELFLNHTGYITAVAASQHEYAYCDLKDGGYFTHFFLRTFHHHIKYTKAKDISWDLILKEVKTKVYNRSVGIVSGSARDDVTYQTPYYDINLRRVRQ
ncbi:MAG: caspase family protein [Bacteroidota bacterium]